MVSKIQLKMSRPELGVGVLRCGSSPFTLGCQAGQQSQETPNAVFKAKSWGQGAGRKLNLKAEKNKTLSPGLAGLPGARSLWDKTLVPVRTLPGPLKLRETPDLSHIRV